MPCDGIEPARDRTDLRIDNTRGAVDQQTFAAMVTGGMAHAFVPYSVRYITQEGAAASKRSAVFVVSASTTM